MFVKNTLFLIDPKIESALKHLIGPDLMQESLPPLSFPRTVFQKLSHTFPLAPACTGPLCKLKRRRRILHCAGQPGLAGTDGSTSCGQAALPQSVRSVAY